MPSAPESKTDVFTPTKRSAVMAAIRGTGNKDTELRLIAIFKAHGISGWRRKRSLPGKPDFVFFRERVAVFVDGCFWHGCPKHATWPKQNEEFWARKLTGNKHRDRKVNRLLRSAGWRVLRIWEHDLARKVETKTVARIRRALAARSKRSGALLR
jgi:DNA mismatch endonuclease (patch repair protein)